VEEEGPVDAAALAGLLGAVIGGGATELYLNLVDRPEHENAAYLPAVK
jgi:hypothetical protein